MRFVSLTTVTKRIPCCWMRRYVPRYKNGEVSVEPVVSIFVFRSIYIKVEAERFSETT